MRRFLLLLGLIIAVTSPFEVRTVSAQQNSPGSIDVRTLSTLAEQLDARWVRSAPAEADLILGIPAADAARVFTPVSPWHPLPDDFAPPDLVRLGSIPRVLGQPVSALLLPDLSSMVTAAQTDDIDLVVLSAYRSFADQQVVFEQNVQRTMYRSSPRMSRGDAERATEQFSARPGYSQHQLGTALDFTTSEMGNGLGPRFAETRAGIWLQANAWRFGFVFPYTAAGEERSGYRNEPWHVRWVGRELARIMSEEQYLTVSFPIADDYVLAAMELVIHQGSVTAQPSPGASAP
jgi:hypothetical protein